MRSLLLDDFPEKTALWLVVSCVWQVSAFFGEITETLKVQSAHFIRYKKLIFKIINSASKFAFSNN